MTEQELAKELAGNWRKFDSFLWTDSPKDEESWCIIHTRTRDDISPHAKVLDRTMKKYPEDAIPQHFTHWAFGWVDGWAIRVYGPDKQLTDAFKAFYKLYKRYHPAGRSK